jgi:DnaJ-class molecular chaperone
MTACANTMLQKRRQWRMENSDDGYVYVACETTRKVKIPVGSVKCPTCRGSGRMRVAYDSKNDFWTCITCRGKGYAEKEWIEHLRERGRLELGE